MDNVLRSVTLDRPSGKISRFENLPYDMELRLLEIIEKEIDLMRRLDGLKADLEYRYDYTPLAAFKSLDRHNEGRVHTYTGSQNPWASLLERPFGKLGGVGNSGRLAP